jgi:anthranilate synthase component 1
MLVDVERSDFARVCEVGTVEALPCETLDAGESQYLSTTVRGRLKVGFDWAAVVVNSFPRAVVVGAPKAAALTYLARLEDRPRGYYGGVTGVVGRDGSLLSIVNVAYAERTGDEVLARCGGGITHRSTAAAELAELEVKLEPHQ